MLLSFKYFFQGLANLILFPLLIWQGKKIKKTIPKLPEAADPSGFIQNGENTLSILFLGESTVAGIGVASHKDGFSGSFAKYLSNVRKCSVQYDVVAKSGYTAAKVEAKLIPKIPDKTYQLIVVGLGGNDSFRLTPPWKWKADLKAIIENLRQQFPQAHIAFASTPPIHIFPAFPRLIQFAVGNWSKLHALKIQDTIINLENISYHAMDFGLDYCYQKLNIPADVNLLFSDGVHPSKLTYKVWAEEMVERLKQNLKV